MRSCICPPIFRRNILLPSSGTMNKPSEITLRSMRQQARERYRASACHLLLLVSCLAYSSTVKMDAICSSEMSGKIYRTTRPHTKRLCRPLSYPACAPSHAQFPPVFPLVPFLIFPSPLVLFPRWLGNEVVVFQPRWSPVLLALELPLDSFGLENRWYWRGKLSNIYMYSGCMVIQVIYIFIFLSCNFWF
jgi:hypothetical protein